LGSKRLPKKQKWKIKSGICRKWVLVALGDMIKVNGERGKEGEWKWKVFLSEKVWILEQECEGKEKEEIEGIVESEESFGIAIPTRNWQALNIASSAMNPHNTQTTTKWKLCIYTHTPQSQN